MIYDLKNNFLQVTVSDCGAELQGIIGRKTGTEYLWQGDPSYWENRAPVIFPICGRLTNGEYLWQNKIYRIGANGFIAQTFFEVERKDNASIVFICRADEKTHTIYPFDFEFRMTYTLMRNSLRCRFTIKNTGTEVLPFSFGGHPGFNVPFVSGEKFDDYYLEFDRPFSANLLEITPDGFWTGNYIPFSLHDGRIIRLKHELFDPDGLFFRDPCHKVALRSLCNNRSITVQFADMNYLGIWQKGKLKSPYLCIEPWHGICSFAGKSDNLATKQDMIHLLAGNTYSTYFDICIDE